MEEGGQAGEASDPNSSFENDLDIEKSSDLDVEAEREKGRSRWDEVEDVSHSRELEKTFGHSREDGGPSVEQYRIPVKGTMVLCA